MSSGSGQRSSRAADQMARVFTSLNLDVDKEHEAADGLAFLTNTDHMEIEEDVQAVGSERAWSSHPDASSRDQLNGGAWAREESNHHQQTPSCQGASILRSLPSAPRVAAVKLTPLPVCGANDKPTTLANKLDTAIVILAQYLSLPNDVRTALKSKIKQLKKNSKELDNFVDFKYQHLCVRYGENNAAAVRDVVDYLLKLELKGKK